MAHSQVDWPVPVHLAGDDLGPAFTLENSRVSHPDWTVAEDAKVEGAVSQCHPTVPGYTFCYLFLDGAWVKAEFTCDTRSDCPGYETYGLGNATGLVTGVVEEEYGDFGSSQGYSGLGWVGASSHYESDLGEMLALSGRLQEYKRRGGSGVHQVPATPSPEGEQAAAAMLQQRRLPADPLLRETLLSRPTPIRTVRSLDLMLPDHLDATLRLAGPALELANRVPEQGEFEATNDYEARVEAWRAEMLMKIAEARTGVENVIWRVVLPAGLQKYDIDRGCFPTAYGSSTTERFEYEVNKLGRLTSFEVAGVATDPKIGLAPSSTVASVVWEKTGLSISLMATAAELCVSVEEAKLLRAADEADRLHFVVFLLRDLNGASSTAVRGRWLGAAFLVDASDGYPSVIAPAPTDRASEGGEDDRLAGAEPDGAGLAEAESAAETDSSGGEPSATQVEAAVGPDISEQISRASRRFQGGSDRWDAAVRPLMVMAYDGDGSGWLDTDAELGSVPCQTWDALDRGIRKKWKSGLRQIYGLKPDLLWVGGSLGIHERMRSSADLQVAACGL